MQTPTHTARITFGMYEVDLHSGELWRSGYRVKLQSQPFKVLAILLENAGQVVTREELQRHLWGAGMSGDFEHSLATAVNKIREALRDSAENPRFVETLARRGYRFIAPVGPKEVSPGTRSPSSSALDLEPLFAPLSSPAMLPEATGTIPATGGPFSEMARPAPPPATAVAPWPHWPVLAGGAVLLVAVGAGVAYLDGLRRPVVSPPHMAQLTHSGHLAVGLDVTESLTAGATDGFHLFVPVVDRGRADIAMMSTTGGSPVELNVPPEIAGPALGDISPDGTRLLLRNHLSPESEQALWVVPTSGGSALRVGDVLAHDATWMPDGSGILYASGNEIRLTHATDTTSQLYVSLPGRAFWLRWDPSGKLLRFTIIDPIAHSASLWQLSATGRKPQQILDEFMEPPTECCGVWTPDGKSFIFQAMRNGNWDLWQLAGQSTSDPTRLTDGPLQFQSPVASRDSKSVFFLGSDSRSQMQTLTTSGELVPERSFLSDAVRLEFSRDKKWVNWVDNSGHLWRSTVDGTDRLQLTPDSLDVFMARWSPDGTRLAFMAREPGRAWRIYLVDANGGEIQPLLTSARNAADPSWSPDGQSIVFGRTNDPFGKDDATRAVYILHIKTGQVDQVHGSEGLFSPRWSPDGHFIAALSLDQRQVRLLDVASQSWRTLSAPSGADPVWSSDSHFLYFHELLDPAQSIDRVTVPGGAAEHLIHLAASPEADAVSYTFSGLNSEDQPLILSRTTAGNVYSLNLK